MALSLYSGCFACVRWGAVPTTPSYSGRVPPALRVFGLGKRTCTKNRMAFKVCTGGLCCDMAGKLCKRRPLPRREFLPRLRVFGSPSARAPTHCFSLYIGCFVCD
ncbi:Protein of unknown function, partial [Gryllus bimaculatus]